MKKNINMSVLFALLLVFIKCEKRTNADLYKGIFTKGHAPCPSLIQITKSFHNGLPVNTYINLTDNIDAKDGQTVRFQILKYALDTIIHTQECVHGQYDASIKLLNQKIGL